MMWTGKRKKTSDEKRSILSSLPGFALFRARSKQDVKKRRDWSCYVFPVIFVFSLHLVFFYLTTLCNIHLQVRVDDTNWPFNSDFLNYWAGARLALSHKIMSIFDSQSFCLAQKDLIGYLPGNRNCWSYPLHLLPLILGIGAFSFEDAFTLWMASTFALYAFAVAYKRPHPWMLTAALALAPASFYNLYFGQNGFLIAALFVGGLRLIEKRPTLAGIAFGLLTVKPQMMVLLPIVILMGKHWRVLAVAAVTSAVLVAISLAIGGTEAWLAYFHKVVPYQVFMLETPPADDNYAMIKSYVTVFGSIRALGGSLSLAYRLSTLSALAAVTATIYACRRASPDLRDMIVLTTIFLATPYAHVYDMPILTAAVVSFYAASRTTTVSLLQILWIAALCLFPLIYYRLNVSGWPVCPLLIAGMAGIGLQAIRAKRHQAEVPA